ncbi:MAG: hypothetical protein JW940_05815, partial [Polyangiaceae bacterium]|nr:hypothetical protein [Polyangiaceae bacterium]
ASQVTSTAAEPSLRGAEAAPLSDSLTAVGARGSAVSERSLEAASGACSAASAFSTLDVAAVCCWTVSSSRSAGARSTVVGWTSGSGAIVRASPSAVGLGGSDFGLGGADLALGGGGGEAFCALGGSGGEAFCALGGGGGEDFCAVACDAARPVRRGGGWLGRTLGPLVCCADGLSMGLGPGGTEAASDFVLGRTSPAGGCDEPSGLASEGPAARPLDTNGGGPDDLRATVSRACMRARIRASRLAPGGPLFDAAEASCPAGWEAALGSEPVVSADADCPGSVLGRSSVMACSRYYCCMSCLQREARNRLQSGRPYGMCPVRDEPRVALRAAQPERGLAFGGGPERPPAAVDGEQPGVHEVVLCRSRSRTRSSP